MFCSVCSVYTMRVGPQGGDFWIRSSSIPPSLLSKMCDIFSNRHSASASGRQLMATTMPYIILEGNVIIPSDLNSLKLYIHLYIHIFIICTIR